MLVSMSHREWDGEEGGIEGKGGGSQTSVIDPHHGLGSVTVPSCFAHQETTVDLLHILGFVAILSHLAHWKMTVDPCHVVGSVASSSLT